MDTYWSLFLEEGCHHAFWKLNRFLDCGCKITVFCIFCFLILKIILCIITLRIYYY